MSMALVLSCLFGSTFHNQKLAWLASQFPQWLNWQIDDYAASVREHLATSRGCYTGQQPCRAAASAASFPTKPVAKQLAPAAGLTEMEAAWHLTGEERDYLIRTIAFEASGEPTMAKIAV